MSRAEQEIGHATALTNILGPYAAKPCNYTYPFQTVGEFINFSQALTRWGEAGVYGFLPHLDSRPSAQILLQSITTEARQQMAFAQFQVCHSSLILLFQNFDETCRVYSRCLSGSILACHKACTCYSSIRSRTSNRQFRAWTLLAPYIASCPAENPKIEWQNFPALTVTVGDPHSSSFF